MGMEDAYLHNRSLMFQYWKISMFHPAYDKNPVTASGNTYANCQSSQFENPTYEEPLLGRQMYFYWIPYNHPIHDQQVL